MNAASPSSYGQYGQCAAIYNPGRWPYAKRCSNDALKNGRCGDHADERYDPDYEPPRYNPSISSLR